MVVSGVDRKMGLYQIFNEMQSISSMKVVAPLPTAKREILKHPLSNHVPVKRIASCPPSQHARAVPKRSRMAIAYDATSRVPSTLHENSYAKAINSGLSGSTNNAAVNSNKSRGLAFFPQNQQPSRFAVNCCPRDNMCFGTSNSVVSTPPYGSCAKDSFAPGGNKASRRISRKLTRKSKKKSPYQTRVIGNSNADEYTASTNTDPFHSQPNAMVVYNTFLKQLEGERKKKLQPVDTTASERQKEEFRYSPGFAPSVTSTPQHKGSTSHSSSKKGAITSDYFSKPSDGFSTKSSNTEDSFYGFLQYIEEGVLSEKQRNPLEERANDVKKESKNDDDSVFASVSNHIRPSKSRDHTFPRKRFVTSTPHHDSSCDVINNNDGKLPGMYPIGAPRAASSPVTCQQQRPLLATGTGFESSVQMWRPWC